MLTLVCKRCGTTLQVAEPREPVCSPCRAAERADSIGSEVWAKVDPTIFANDIIRGMQLIANLTSIDFGDARDLFYARYRRLRATRAAEFSCDHEAYWRGYSS